MLKRILIIEDNRDIAQLVRINLRSKQLQVDHAAAGEKGLTLALGGGYQLIILDLMLPDMDGLDLCRTLRKQNIFTPVLMLTAKTSEIDRVLGLEVGADDYLTKPFSVPELVARVKAIMRRAEQYQAAPAAQQQPLQIGGMTVDPVARKVNLGDRPIDLTAKEFDLLWHFARHPGRVYSRAQLLDQVWGYGHEGYEHTVNSHINRLRAKIEANPANPEYVITVWGVGYRFSEPEAPERPR